MKNDFYANGSSFPRSWVLIGYWYVAGVQGQHVIVWWPRLAKFWVA